jgi:hypothetical protein
MIHLNFGLNEIFATASENITIPNAGNVTKFVEGYFGIYSQVTKQTKWLYIINLDTYYPRIDNFYIELVTNQGNESLEQGIVYLKDTGNYEYSIYTRFENNPEPNSSEQLLERGKLLYGFNDLTVTTYNPDIEIITYDRQ